MKRKKIWIISGASVLLILLIVGYIFFNKRSTVVLNAMPADALLFFDISNGTAFNSLINDEPAFIELTNTGLFGGIKNDFILFSKVCGTKAELLSDIMNRNFLAGSFISGEGAVDQLFLLQVSEASKLKLSEFLPELDGEKPQSTHHKFEHEEIYEINFPVQKIHIACAKVNGIFMMSRSTVLIENAVLQLNSGDPVTENETFRDVYAKMDRNLKFALYLNTERLADYFSMFSTNEKYNDIMKLKAVNSWLGLQLDFKEDGIVINGYASADDQLLNKYTGEFNSTMRDAVPSNTVVLYRINSERLTEGIANKFTEEKTNRDYFDHWSPWMGNNLLFGISESLDPKFLKRSFLIIPATDSKLAADKLKYCIISDSLQYNGHIIMEINSGEIVSGIAGVKFPETCFAAWVGDNIIISAEKIQLKSMLDAVENGETLSRDADYEIFSKQISSSFNNDFYINLGKSEGILKSFISDKKIDSIEKQFPLLQKFQRMEIQFSNNKNILLLNGFISFTPSPKRKSGALWNLQVDHPIEAGPFTVNNTISRQRNIVVQDTADQVYLISANGDILWKQQLGNRITGDIIEVDFYNNGSSQLLFNTDNAIYLLDISGNTIEGFPILLTSVITNPISVIQGTENSYRMYVACNNDNIYGFFKDGKPVPGWNPKKNTGEVKLPVMDLKGSSAYTIFINNKEVQFNNENGKKMQSVPLKNSIIYGVSSGNGLYLLDDKGNVITVDDHLKTKFTPASEKFLTGGFAKVNDDDTLDIISLDDIYFKARSISGKSIFIAEAAAEYNTVVSTTFNHISYFGMASTGSRLVLFSADGKILDGFPVKGSEHFLIDDLALSGDKMLVTVYDNVIYAYRIK